MPSKKRGKQEPHNNEKEPRGASESEKTTLSTSDKIQIIMAILTIFL